MTSPIFCAALDSPENSLLVARTLLTASGTTLVVCATCWPISVADVDIWRVATAAFSTLIEAPCDACRMPLARCEVCSDEPNSLVAVDFIVSVQSRDGREHAFDALAERRNGGIDRVAVRLLGHVFVGRDPAAAGHRRPHDLDQAAVGQLVDPARNRVGRVLAQRSHTVRAPTSPGCRCDSRCFMISSCVVPGASKPDGSEYRRA